MTEQWPSVGLGHPRAAVGSSRSPLWVQSGHPLSPREEKGQSFRLLGWQRPWEPAGRWGLFCVELIRRLGYSSGKPEVTYADYGARHPLSLEANPLLSPKTCEILELQALASKQFIWGSSMPRRQAWETPLLTEKASTQPTFSCLKKNP